MKSTALRTASIGYTIALVFVLGVGVVSAQSYTTVASNIVVEGSVRDGDVISYDPSANSYHPSSAYADELMYGVVVFDPVLNLLENNEGAPATGVPVVRYGEVSVNVSTLGGYVRAGDLITTSPIEGFAQRVPREAGTYVLGFAIEDMTIGEDTITVGGETVQLGRVPVALRIGPYVTKEGSERIASSTLLGSTGLTSTEEQNGIDMFKLLRYIMASLVAALAILVSARRFGDTFSQSVISVGRNPLARSQIRSIVIWNSFLIIVISSVGFGISALILFLP